VLIVYLYRLHPGKDAQEYLHWFREVQQQQLRDYECVQQVQVIPLEALDEGSTGWDFLEIIEVTSREDWLAQVQTPQEQEALARWRQWGDLDGTLSLVETSETTRWVGAGNAPAAPTHA
jgi:hypothetical protein